MAQSKDLIALVFERCHAALLKHSEILTPQEFFDLLKKATNNPAAAPAHTFSSISNESRYTMGTTSNTQCNKNKKKDAITATFRNRPKTKATGQKADTFASNSSGS
jgi:hypothetical protein